MTILTLILAMANKTTTGPSTYWIVGLSGSETHQASQFSKNAAGNVYLVGTETVNSTVPVGNNIDGYLVQSTGATVSQFTAGFGYYGEQDFGVSVSHDGSDNSLWLAKSKEPSGDGTYGAYITKKNNSETIQWEYFLKGVLTPTCIDTNSVGSSIVVDSSLPALCYVDTNGLLSSAKQLSAGAFFAIVVNGTDAYVVGCTATGDSVDKTSASADAFVAKVGFTGVISWQKSLGGASGCSAYSVCLDSAGDVIVGGICEANGTEGIFIAKYAEATGALTWQRKIATGGTAGASYIAKGGFVTAGASASVYVCGTINNGDSTYSTWIGKLDSSGTLSWQRKLRPTGASAYGRAIYRDSGGLYVAASLATTMIVARLPDDGTLTGTYDTYVYSTATQTDSAAGLTDATPAYTFSTASTVTRSTVAATYGSGTLTPARQPVQ